MKMRPNIKKGQSQRLSQSNWWLYEFFPGGDIFQGPTPNPRYSLFRLFLEKHFFFFVFSGREKLMKLETQDFTDRKWFLFFSFSL